MFDIMRAHKSVKAMFERVQNFAMTMMLREDVSTSLEACDGHAVLGRCFGEMLKVIQNLAMTMMH